MPDVEKHTINPSKAISIGIDLGVSSFLIDSNGKKVDSPKFLQKKAARLKRYQRQVSKKCKGSKNRNRARIRLAKWHRTIRNSRADWLHKLSNKIVNINDIICVEDLKTKDLMIHKNQKSLNRAIADQGWGMFLNMLRYKCEHRGKTFTQINQYKSSSKTCSSCGYKIDNMNLKIRNWICPQCGTEHDRDVNAALNILWWGLMATPNTEGTSEINACGVSKPFVNNEHMFEIGKDTTRPVIGTKQEACRLKNYR